MKIAVGTGWNALIHFQDRTDCAKAEEGLKTTHNSDYVLSALATDNPQEYVGVD